ncbi:unnamed protein product, partial [marine sediment metagenome]
MIFPEESLRKFTDRENGYFACSFDIGIDMGPKDNFALSSVFPV